MSPAVAFLQAFAESVTGSRRYAGNGASRRYVKVRWTRDVPRLDSSVITNAADLELIVPGWIELFYESRTRNPFAHPRWLTTWVRHYAGTDSLHVVVVHRGARL